MSLVSRVTPMKYVKGIIVIWAQITQGLMAMIKTANSFKYDGKSMEGFGHGGNVIFSFQVITLPAAQNIDQNEPEQKL